MTNASQHSFLCGCVGTLSSLPKGFGHIVVSETFVKRRAFGFTRYRCLAFCWPQACDAVVRVCRCTGARWLMRAALLALNHAVCTRRSISHGPSGLRLAAPCIPRVCACFCPERDRSKGPWASAKHRSQVRSQVRAKGQVL